MKIDITYIYTKALNIATDNNQTIDFETEMMGGEGDYFITLAQLQDIMMSQKDEPVV